MHRPEVRRARAKLQIRLSFEAPAFGTNAQQPRSRLSAAEGEDQPDAVSATHDHVALQHR
jgi:hypothetical protein